MFPGARIKRRICLETPHCQGGSEWVEGELSPEAIFATRGQGDRAIADHTDYRPCDWSTFWNSLVGCNAYTSCFESKLLFVHSSGTSSTTCRTLGKLKRTYTVSTPWGGFGAWNIRSNGWQNLNIWIQPNGYRTPGAPSGRTGNGVHQTCYESVVRWGTTSVLEPASCAPYQVTLRRVWGVQGHQNSYNAWWQYTGPLQSNWARVSGYSGGNRYNNCATTARRKITMWRSNANCGIFVRTNSKSTTSYAQCPTGATGGTNWRQICWWGGRYNRWARNNAENGQYGNPNLPRHRKGWTRYYPELRKGWPYIDGRQVHRGGWMWRGWGRYSGGYLKRCQRGNGSSGCR